QSATAPDDQGVIRCICGFSEDDGYTIQCENCMVWQHVACVISKGGRVPDEYWCEICDPRELDAKRAHDYQAARIEHERRRGRASSTPDDEDSGSSGRKRGSSTSTKQRRPIHDSPSPESYKPPAERRRKVSTSS
ncbi:SET domain-containing protein 3, partial [Spiromyces aspiralis]